jgi:hypothetical protein
MIHAKINFLHDARPYISADEYANIVVSFPEGALPNRGDIVQIDDITHPEGAFFVNHRVFEARKGSLCAVTLTLGVEGVHKMP